MSATENAESAAGTEGGYYAIKGFLYQFDKTLIEVLTNHSKLVAFENEQDINYEKFVIQVKHKETQKYSHSKIRRAVEQLMHFFSHNRTKEICLYCYFKDTQPQDWRMTAQELDKVLSQTTKASFPATLRTEFLSKFIVRFSENYESQFRKLLGLIRSSFGIAGQDLAVLYHSIFRSKLLETSILSKEDRRIRFSDLKRFLGDLEVRIFGSAYDKYLGADKYARVIKRAFFTPAFPNIENFERLLVLECDEETTTGDVIKFAHAASNKWYRKGKSPQPYLAIRCLPGDQLNQIKQALFDTRIHFFDGTHFHGDRFRLDELAGEPPGHRTFVIKLVDSHQVAALAQKIAIRETFQFFATEPLRLNHDGTHRRIQIKSIDQALRILA